jgi:glycosyltransferase involved in cell wall biosynthesis
MSVPAPTTAVVIATHNRAPLLSRLITALAQQTDAGEFQVVVVDDGSTDDTWQVLSALRASAPFKLTALRLAENSGPGAARNAGWRAAEADVIAFTDDDCVPEPTWLRTLVRRLTDADLVQGRTVADPAQAARRGPFSHVVEFDKPDGYYETCNIAYRRRLLELVDGFEEGFRYGPSRWRAPAPVYGEDTDLAWRALEHGARTAFEPDAVVFHDVSASSFLARLRRVRRAETFPRLVRRHPAMRDLMYWRWFYLSYHPPALLAAAGTLLTLRPRSPWWHRALGMLCWLPYADNRMHRIPLWTRRRYQVALLPVALVTDLAEVGVLVRASVRERTVLL